MKKLTNEEIARQKELAENYARKVNEDWNNVYNALGSAQRNFIGEYYGETCTELAEHLKNGGKPSDYFKTKGKWLFEGCILKRHEEAFLYLTDQVSAFSFQQDWGIKSFRSKNYFLYQKRIHDCVKYFCDMRCMDVDYADFLENNLTEEQIAYKQQKMSLKQDDLLIYEIDTGNERVINYVKNALESGSSTAISYHMLSAVFQSRNTELHESVCKLLLAAKRQEGLRRAICENCDTGRIEPFLMVLKTIRDHDLIRYSSVKRAVGYFIGLLNEESRDSDQISAKIPDIIINCLEDDAYLEKCLQDEDAMKIYIALWATGCHDINHCMEKISQIIDNGSSQQAMTAGIFVQNNCPEFQQSFAVRAVLQRHEELDVMAVYLPLMASDRYSYSFQFLHWCRIPAPDRYSREEAERLYAILNEMLLKLPKKNLEINPCVFPWNTACLTKSDIVTRLCLLASDLRDTAKVDETCTKIPLIKSKNYDGEGRWQQIKLLLSNPKTETQLDTLVSFACDKDEDARKEVFTILNKCQLEEKHFRMLEDMLRYKAADMRQSLIDVLFRQSEEQLFACVKRLCMDSKEEKRTAGLDMLIRICQSDRSDDTKSEYRALIKLIENPSSKEKILMERICRESEGEKEEGYGLYKESDDYIPNVDEDFIASCKADFIKLFPETQLFGNKAKWKKGKLSDAISGLLGKKPNEEKISMHDIISSLDALIEEHKNDEYEDNVAGKCLLANYPHYRTFKIKDEEGKLHIAFRELWDEFYKEYIHDETLLLKLKIYIAEGMLEGSLRYYGSSNFAEEIFGKEYAENHAYMHPEIIKYVMNYYYENYLNRENYISAVCALGYYIAYEAKVEKLYGLMELAKEQRFPSTQSVYLDGRKRELKCTEKQKLATVISDEKTNALLSLLSFPKSENKEQFKNVFSIRFMIGKRFGFFDLNKKEREDQDYPPFTVYQLVLAAYLKIISQEFLYKMLMTKFLSSALTDLSLLLSYHKSGEARAVSRFRRYSNGEAFIKALLEIPDDHKLSEYKLTTEDYEKIVAQAQLCKLQGNLECARNMRDNYEKLDFAAGIGKELLETILNVELARGDTETEFSRELDDIMRIFGAEKLVKILTAMGKDTLDRSTFFSTNDGVSKKQALSYLLGICVPDPEDDAAKLKELLAATDVKENRIVETALYSTAWLDIIEEYLGWKGLTSACYYFIAHTNEDVNEKTEALIAKYTPISMEDLNAGAFDLEWFKEAFQTLGEERFDKVYQAAKYISTGAKHVRARKYADAARGKLNREQTTQEITEKRNKDSLMAYALIPIENEEDLAERYLFIQEFKKQGKNFGAQRRASEGIAADRALQNLAINAGFSDVSRLMLRMEAKLFENVKPLLDWNDIDEIRLKIEIDDDGTTEILCEKNGKTLKSIPAKYKKNETVLAMKETKQQLTEQYQRTRQMFEDAMENETIFTAGELHLLCTNLAIKPIVSRLVYKAGDKLGFLDGEVLRDFAGKEEKITNDTELKIAHPYDFYIEGHWHEYQKYLFDHAIIQPFKQIFRELYVKTAEEAQRYNSARYEGNQVQPAKTKALLKSRRWVADVENGLQKIYYQQNIIASIFALADWFSPADIETPSLEWVAFLDRKAHAPIQIADVPDIIFSEVMRDMDLAVSVAHVGTVDPETSHSTIEMRKAIAEFTLPLFKLKNVRLEGSHAFIEGERADYSIHLGSGVVHQQGGSMINVLPVHSPHGGRLFLPFVDEDPKTAQILSEILLFAEDQKIKDPFILEQIV